MKSHAFRWLHTSSTLPTTLDASSARRGSTCFSPAHENCQLDPKINDLMMIRVEHLGGTFSLEKIGVANLLQFFDGEIAYFVSLKTLFLKDILYIGPLKHYLSLNLSLSLSLPGGT